MRPSKSTCACQKIDTAEFLADLVMLRQMYQSEQPTPFLVHLLDQLILKYQHRIQEAIREH